MRNNAEHKKEKSGTCGTIVLLIFVIVAPQLVTSDFIT